MTTRDAEDDLEETQPFPESVLDERWSSGPPVEAIRAAQAQEPVDREAVTEVLSASAEPGIVDARQKLVEEIATFVESRASDRSEGEHLAREIRSAFS